MNEEDNLSEEGLGDIIKKRDERLLKLYNEINNPKDPKSDEKFLEERSKEETFEQKELNLGADIRKATFQSAQSGQLAAGLTKAFGKPGLIAGGIITTGANVADIFLSPDKDGNLQFDNPKLLDILPFISSRILEGTTPKGLLKEQKDLPKDKTKGLLPSESEVPLDVIKEYPSIQEMYETKGLNPNQKGMLKSIFDRITGKSEEEIIVDPEDKYFGAIKEDVETAEGYYGTPPRAFFNKRKVDKRGRIFDLATGEFNVNELARRYPGKKNQGFRREVQALAVDERFTLTTFARTRNEIIEDWFDGLEDAKGAVDNPARDLEAHHIRSIRHMGALMSDMNRSERVRFNKILWKNAMGVGHNPANIILLSSSRFNDIHGRLHDKLDEQIGRYAEKLIDPNKKYTFAEKIEIAKRMGQITNRYTFEAYEEMADYLDSLMLKASPAAEMAAKMDIAELEARLDFRIDELQRRVNKEGYTSLARQIQQIPGSSIGFGQIPADYEDEDPTLFQRTRLVRGPGKKTIERQKRYEELYGKQGSLF
tara:strand:+ start:63 stop:1676 length:1614 start_codon:yes stop_codon:yes gene_type:complete